MAVTSQIVTVNATVVAAPAPSTLQQSGAFISLGGTTLTVGSYEAFTSVAALEAVLSMSGNYLELMHMATTFFAQGNAVGVYVLELGVQGTVAEGPVALQTWITANPNVFYSYLNPFSWDSAAAAVVTLGSNNSSATSKVYFFQTSSPTTYVDYAGSEKSIVVFVPSPTASSSEFGAAAMFYQWLANSPSAATPAGPMAFRYVYGVTPWTLMGNQTTINAILTAYGNLYLTGAEGNIANVTIRNGTTLDGNQMMGWYAIDWIQINGHVALADAIINGSNQNPPLLYNQAGVNTLLVAAEAEGTQGISYQLLQSATFSATSFASYIAANPSNYQAGIYNGITCTAVPTAGFIAITFNLTAQFSPT